MPSVPGMMDSALQFSCSTLQLLRHYSHHDDYARMHVNKCIQAS